MALGESPEDAFHLEGAGEPLRRKLFDVGVAGATTEAEDWLLY